MTLLRNSLSLFIAILLLGSCAAPEPDGTVLKGTVQGGEDMQLFFDHMVMNKTEVIGKAPIGSDGTFNLELTDGLEPGIYRIRVGSQRALVFFDGTESTVEINTSVDKIGTYDFHLEGAPEGNALVMNVRKIRGRELDAKGITKLAEEAKDPILAMHYAAALPPDAGNLVVMKQVSERLQETYPESDYTLMYKSQIDNIEKQMARMQAQEVIRVGQPAPDIVLPNPDGEVMKLSELKGQVVLLDFWASWCGPCRRANPHVVQTYEKYKDKGFTVYSVSLDRPGQMDRWKQAIEADALAWPYHVSDLKYWNSAPASTYGVRGIPKTFLIDKDGTIASTNVSPYNLDQELEKLL